MAQRLAERGNAHIVATGITPSGEFHIGHLREILTGDMIARAARRAGMDAELVFATMLTHFARCTRFWTMPTRNSSVIKSVQFRHLTQRVSPTGHGLTRKVGPTPTIFFTRSWLR